MRPFFGVSAYAAAAWNKKTVNNYFKCFPANIRRPATALVWGPFGRPVLFAKRFITWAAERPHLIEIHISAETARRTGRNGKQIALWLGVSEYDRALRNKDPEVLKQVRQRVKVIRRSIEPLTNKKTVVVLSTGVEDNLSSTAANVLINEVSLLLPDKWMVCRNPMVRQAGIENALIEGHGRTYHEGQNIWNFDGTHVGKYPNSRVADIGYDNALYLIRAANKEYLAVFLWSALAQGWKYSGQPYTGRTFVITEEEQAGFSRVLAGIQK